MWNVCIAQHHFLRGAPTTGENQELSPTNGLRGWFDVGWDEGQEFVHHLGEEFGGGG